MDSSQVPLVLETPACLTAVLRYLILLDLRLHAWVILRSETFIAWSLTSLLSEKWFLHKNQAALLKHRVLLFTPKESVHAQNLDIWQNAPAFSLSSIACISPSGYLMPQKNFGGCSRKLHCLFWLIEVKKSAYASSTKGRVVDSLYTLGTQSV